MNLINGRTNLKQQCSRTTRFSVWSGHETKGGEGGECHDQPMRRSACLWVGGEQIWAQDYNLWEVNRSGHKDLVGAVHGASPPAGVVLPGAPAPQSLRSGSCECTTPSSADSCSGLADWPGCYSCRGAGQWRGRGNAGGGAMQGEGL